MQRTRTDLVTWRAETSGWGLSDERSGLKGIVGTPHGYVKVYSLRNAVNPDGGGPVTRFHFIWRGREWVRSYNKMLSRFGAIREAARFARRVARGEERPR